MQEDSTPSPQLLQGIEEFNRQEFFECHETLEALWNVQSEPERQFTQGIIQIAVGYYHLLRNNRDGARKLFKRGLGRISQFQPVHRGLNVDALARAVADNLDELNAIPDDRAINPAIPSIQNVR